MKKVDLVLDMCVDPENIIKTRTLVEEDEVLSAVKNDTLGNKERLTLVEEKHDTLTTARDPHKERNKEIGKLIA